MAISVKTRLIKIGNSRGIRIPKLLIDQVGLNGEIDLELRDSQLILRPAARSKRRGHTSSFLPTK